MIDATAMHELSEQRLSDIAKQERQRISSLIEEFTRCSEWLQAALDHNIEETHTLNDICKGVVEGRYQFWPAEDAAIITEILDYPKARHLHGFLAGGSLDRIRHMIPSLEDFARQNGCTACTINGRPGWSRALADMGYVKGLMMTAKVFDKLPAQGGDTGAL